MVGAFLHFANSEGEFLKPLHKFVETLLLGVLVDEIVCQGQVITTPNIFHISRWYKIDRLCSMRGIDEPVEQKTIRSFISDTVPDGDDTSVVFNTVFLDDWF